MLTRCPTCQTVFRVGQEQLDARHGIVRCGHCLKPFAALQNKLEELAEARPAPPPPPPEPPKEPRPAVSAPPRGESVAKRPSVRVVISPQKSPAATSPAATTVKIPPRSGEAPPRPPEKAAPETPASASSEPRRETSQTATTLPPRTLSGLDFSTLGNAPPARKEPHIGTPAAPQQPPRLPDGIGAWQKSLHRESRDPAAHPAKPGEEGAERQDWPDMAMEDRLERGRRIAASTQSRPPGRIEPADNAVWRKNREDEAESIYSPTLHGSLETRKVVAPDLNLVPMAAENTSSKRVEPKLSRPPGGGVLSRPVEPPDDDEEFLTIAPLTRIPHSMEVRLSGESTTASVEPFTGFPTTSSLLPSLQQDDEDEAEMHVRRLDKTYGQPAKRGGFRKFVYGFLIFVLGVAALLQGAFLFRAELARELPGLRHVIVSLCDAMDCAVPLPHEIDLIEIVDSDLQAQLGVSGQFVLHATLINRAGYVQQWPSLELTLTDAIDNPVSRKVLGPRDWAPPERLPSGFPPRSEAVVRLTFHTDLVPTGYHLYAFYP